MTQCALESEVDNYIPFSPLYGPAGPMSEKRPAAGSCLTPDRPLTVSERRVAVIGTGSWGRELVRTFAELGSLRAVCDSDAARLALQPNGMIRHYHRLEDCLRDPGVSAVAIATPAVSHFELVRSALQAGKDVLVEKPLALTIRDGQELVDYATNTNRILMVGNVLRFHPAVGKLKDMIDADELGRVEYICSSRPCVDRLRSEENILWSFAPQEVSVILGLLGELPINASCQGGDYVGCGVSDVTISQFQFAGGIRAQVFVSRLRPFKEQRLVVVGSTKMAVFDESAPDRLVTYPRRDWKYPAPKAEEAPGEPVLIDSTEPIRAECQAFLSSLDTRRAPVSNGSEELRVLEVLDACERSLSNDGARTAVRPPARSQIHNRRQSSFRCNTERPVSAGIIGSPAWDTGCRSALSRS
jgi:UDP-2-acetamido-3-amino-2,3-dideoxy-glucuronate N-acetyltransferase